MPSRASSVYNIGKLIGVKETVGFMISKGSQIKNKVQVENVVIISVMVNCSPTCGGGRGGRSGCSGRSSGGSCRSSGRNGSRGSWSGCFAYAPPIIEVVSTCSGTGAVGVKS